MYQNALSRLVRDDLPRAPVPHFDRLKIEAYFYEMVVELSDAEAVAFLNGLKQFETSGSASALVRSVVSRMIRLIECDVILGHWE
jgi:hypothetical protein